MVDEMLLLMAHRATFRNHKQVALSNACGCFHCLKTFPPADIRNWADRGETALCPYCGMDSVLADNAGFALTEEFLTAMKTRFFQHS